MVLSSLTERAASPGLHSVLRWTVPQSLVLEALAPERDNHEVTGPDRQLRGTLGNDAINKTRREASGRTGPELGLIFLHVRNKSVI